MLKYILKRILQAIPLLILITVICFALINLAPYDAVDAITTPDMSAAEIEMRREAYGLNDPVYVQYFRWLNNILHGNFGYSLLSHTSIKYDLMIRIPNTAHIDDIEISEGLLPLAKANPHIEILTEPYDLPFDEQGNLF